MSILSVQNLSCTQGIKTLFENISFGIEPGDKIALIGVNGSGKTTLLSHITSCNTDRNPSIVTKQNLKITHLAQLPTFNPEDTILDHLFKSETLTAKAIRAYHLCIEKLETETGPVMNKEFEDATAQMDLHQAWDYESRVTSILNELNIHHLSQQMKTLSGGMIKKIGLAQVFFEETDLLILDEPTNHLDIDTINWLENTLKRMQGTLLMVTHDRYFLDKICTKIIEIDQQKLFTYNGNYQVFLEQKDLRYAIQQKEDQSLQSVLRVELEWLKRGPKARSTKQKARKDRIADMVSRNTYTEDTVLELGVAGRRLGKKILELKDITKKFDDKTVISKFTYTFKQGEKIGILGPNGAGKTTLLNIISERIQPDSGTVDVGVNTVFGYFDQHSISFDLNMSVLEHVKLFGEHITLHDGTLLSAAKLLERFLFPSSSLKTKIGKLSGGERRRLHMVCMLLSNPNFLLFDEPTNDLDITTLSVLEDFLLHFAGCVIVISHDRYFMDRVVDQLLIFKDKGHVTHFWGGYTDYIDTLKEMAKIPTQKTLPSTPRTNQSKDPKELKKIETEIEKLEKEIKTLNNYLGTGAHSPEDYAKTGKQLKELSNQLEQKFARWEELA